MSKIDHLQKLLSDITNQIRNLNQLIHEKTEHIQNMETTLLQLQENITAEKIQLDEYQAQLTGALEMKTETDRYFEQIEKNIDTLMTILTSSRV